MAEARLLGRPLALAHGSLVNGADTTPDPGVGRGALDGMLAVAVLR